MPKISLFHLFILHIELISESHHMTGHIHFWSHQPQNFQLPFNLHEFVPACKKSVNSWDTVNLRVQRPDLLNLLWRNSSFRNYAIWLAESILAYISGTWCSQRFLCRNTANNKHIHYSTNSVKINDQIFL